MLIATVLNFNNLNQSLALSLTQGLGLQADIRPLQIAGLSAIGHFEAVAGPPLPGISLW